MLASLDLMNIGPAKEMHLSFGKRLNLITGDNGLGKSFLLDIAWWALTRKWPAEVNPRLTVGKKAQPLSAGEAKIVFSFEGKTKTEKYESVYLRKDQAWSMRQGRPTNPGLVLYAMTDGSFAVWDPHRNYWKSQEDFDSQIRRLAYVFTPNEVWDGLNSPDGTCICNGLIRDWAGWQKENGASFSYLKKVLEVLSPSPEELLRPGDLTRISLDDVRDIPTIRMPYGQDVPVLYASSGMKRIIALAYFLVWSWEEHRKAAAQLDEPPADQIVFLIDEIESHLHPSWQRTVVPTLLSVMGSLTAASVQLITATHSPLIMASAESVFDSQSDAWFDLDLESSTADSSVNLKQRQFVRHGDVSNWLTSEAFDLKSARSIDSERALEEAIRVMSQESLSEEEARVLDDKLKSVLGSLDPFWMRWRFFAEKKGWHL